MDDITKLENKLKKIGKVEIPSALSSNLKSRVMLGIKNSDKNFGVQPSSVSGMIEKVRGIFETVDLSAQKKAYVKERILERITSYSRMRFYFSRFFVSQKKAWAYLVLTLFVFNIFIFVDGGVPVVEAKSTILQNVFGNVQVFRDGESLKGQNDFVLLQGDVVKTENKSKAMIRFFDDSISRLQENTEVVLSRLFLDETGSVTEVLLDVRGGVVWSKVCKFVPGDTEFSVKGDNVFAQAKEKAAFNVSAGREGDFKVDVFENKVDLHVVRGDKVVSESVSEGTSANVEKEAETISLVNLPEPDEWVSENLNEDKRHLGEVIEETKEVIAEEAGVLPENILLHPIKRIKEDTTLLFAFDDVEKAKIRLEIAEKRLLEAEAFVARGEKLELSDFKKGFESSVDEFRALMADIKKVDLVEYVDLNSYLKSKLKRQERNLLFVEPRDEAVEEELKEEFIKPLDSAKEEEPLGVEPVDEKDGHALPTLDLYLNGGLESEETQDDAEGAEDHSDDPEPHDDL